MRRRIFISATLFYGEAIRGVFRHAWRSFLTVLGITIGIAAVVCVVAIGKAGSARAEELLLALGDNLVWVEAGSRSVNGVRTGTKGTDSLTVEDSEAIAREITSIKSASPQIDGSILVAYGNRNWTTHYRGVSPDFIDIRRWPVLEGTSFTEGEVTNAANVCVLGQTVRLKLFGSEDPIGKDVRFASRLICQVVGVLTPKGQSATGQDQDDTILLPYTTAQTKIRGSSSRSLDDIMCSAISRESVDATVSSITALLRERHHILEGQDDDFNIRRPDEVIKVQIEASHTLAVLLVSIAAISLLVGGIGIMNVMLVSVAERTKEIGVRRAVGATAGDVQLQFLGESIMLSLLGGVMGVVLGVVATLVIGRVLEWPTSIPIEALIVAPGFAIAVGITFGFYPAWRASRLDPIVALRDE